MTAEIYPFRRPSESNRGWRGQAVGSLGTITDYIPRFAEHLRAQPAAATTIDRYVLSARLFADYLGDPDLSAIARADVERWVGHRLTECTGSTVSGNFVSLKQFFKFLKEELAPDPFTDPTEGMKAPKFEERPIKIPTPELLAGMIKHAADQRDAYGERPFEGVRDEVILRMFIETGARLDEITSLTLHDYLGDRMRVMGKSKGAGKVERQVRIGPKTQQALKRYLRWRARHPQAHLDRLFLGKKGRMTPSGVRQMIWKRSLAVGGPEGRVHPHAIRHYFAHTWKTEPDFHDGDLMEIMGWRTEAMLHRYGKSAAAERAGNAHARFLESRG